MTGGTAAVLVAAGLAFAMFAVYVMVQALRFLHLGIRWYRRELGELPLPRVPDITGPPAD